MKKFCSVLLAAMMVFAFTGIASAYNANLTMIVYDNSGTGSEMFFDLGTPGTVTDVTSLIPADITTQLDVASLADLNVGIFGGGNLTDGTGNYWFATTSATAPGIVQSSNISFDAATGNIASYYESITIGNSIDPNSYFATMNLGDKFSAGQYAGLNGSVAEGEGSLSGGLTMYLYNYEMVPGALPWDPVTFTMNKGTDTTTDYFAAITVANAPAVPVPAAVWLLGSGLIGVIGLRRKNG